MKKYLKIFVFISFLIIFQSFFYMMCKLSPFKITVINSSFDQKIPFIPAFGLFYYVWYIFLFLVPFILYKKNPKYFYKYAAIDIIAVLIGAIVFIFFPTTIDRGVDLSTVNSPFKFLIEFIYFTDTPNLCCLPSMHCALAYIFIYMAVYVKDLKKLHKFGIIIVSIGIVLSTLFIKQHVIWDVLTAVILIIISVIINNHIKLEDFVQKKFENFKLIK